MYCYAIYVVEVSTIIISKVFPQEIYLKAISAALSVPKRK